MVEHRSRAPRFLEFERWWGGFYLFNEEEIRWIVNNLFVGNKLTYGEARLGPGRYFDLKSIKQPIIVFASMGDNITPPQQAFNWIADVYSSSEEIKANGQTIVGLLHEDIGHLGIFVSGQVAKKEHAQIVEVLKYIQQLPPGLYGMDIEEHHDRRGEVSYEVTLRERKIEDLHPTLAKNDRVDEKPFQAVAALSELSERAYSLLVRPFVRELTPEWFAKALRDFHPLRVQYWALSDKNPFLWPLAQAAAMVTANRRPRGKDNDNVRGEKLLSESVSARLDLYRDVRDALSEAAFFEVYGNMMSLQMADEREEIRRKGKFDPRSIAAVREVLDTLEEGSAIEGLARIAMLISKAGSGHRRLSQMQTTREILSPEGEISHLSEDERRRLLQEETIVVEFEPERAKRSLPKLLRTAGRAPARACAARMDRGAARARGARSARSPPSCAGCCRSPAGAVRPRSPASARRRPSARRRAGDRRRARAERVPDAREPEPVMNRQYTNKTFDEIAIGATDTVTRTLTATEVEGLSLVTGDVETFHLDLLPDAVAEVASAPGAAAIALIAAILNRRMPGPGSAIVGTPLQLRRPPAHRGHGDGHGDGARQACGRAAHRFRVQGGQRRRPRARGRCRHRHRAEGARRLQRHRDTRGRASPQRWRRPPAASAASRSRPSSAPSCIRATAIRWSGRSRRDGAASSCRSSWARRRRSARRRRPRAWISPATASCRRRTATRPRITRWRWRAPATSRR